MLWRGVGITHISVALFGVRAGSGSVLSRGGMGDWGRLHVTPWASENDVRGND